MLYTELWCPHLKWKLPLVDVPRRSLLLNERGPASSSCCLTLGTVYWYPNKLLSRECSYSWGLAWLFRKEIDFVRRKNNGEWVCLDSRVLLRHIRIALNFSVWPSQSSSLRCDYLRSGMLSTRVFSARTSKIPSDFFPLDKSWLLILSIYGLWVSAIYPKLYVKKPSNKLRIMVSHLVLDKYWPDVAIPTIKFFHE